MGASLIELHAISGPQSSVDALNEQLLQLVGEPYQFARISYGDELTLHFGNLRPARNPKLKDKPYGSYVLGARGSSWFLKSGKEAVMITADPAHLGHQLSKEELESGRFIGPGSRVVGAAAFPVHPAECLGLKIQFSDGSALVILPVITAEESQSGKLSDEDLPDIADWELSTPAGHLSAGPGLAWDLTAKMGQSDK